MVGVYYDSGCKSSSNQITFLNIEFNKKNKVVTLLVVIVHNSC